MKRSIYFILAFVIISIISCGKIPINGELDGQWQLMELNTKSSPNDPEYSIKTDKKLERVYWSFQLDLLMVHETGITPLIFARFNHAQKQLNITEIYKNFRSSDSLITDPNSTLLEPIGIHGNAEDFQVEKLNGKQMILKTNEKKLIFKKLG